MVAQADFLMVAQADFLHEFYKSYLMIEMDYNITW